MPKNDEKKPKIRVERKAKTSVRSDLAGPCSRLDQQVTSLESQLSGLLALIASPPVVPSVPTLGPNGWAWEPV